jgi:hypothetical protein
VHRAALFFFDVAERSGGAYAGFLLVAAKSRVTAV